VIEIRPARDDDDAALLALDAETWSVDATPAPPRQGVTSFFASRLDPTDAIVADLDGVVVGYATLHNAIPLPAHADVLEINGVAVHPAATGQGIGQALVEAAVAEAVRRGARKVSLRVLGPNTVARRLYARCGFVEEGVLRAEFLLGGRFVDDVIMSRFVDPAEVTPPSD
jgi:RimJ/RimL family protein N-acetyltransferase